MNNKLHKIVTFTLVIGTIALALYGCSGKASSMNVATPVVATSKQDKKVFPVKILGNVVESAPSKVMPEDLSSLTQTTYTVDNPWDKKRHTYQGVLLRDLAAAFGKANTNRILVRAIDDFKAEFSKTEWDRWDILLATHEDGRPMSVAKGGPMKIVLPYHNNKELDPTVYNDRWIWTINRIEFKSQ